MSSKKYLLLRLEGPMQAWGRQSHWDLRATDSLPTKSAVVGLIGSAMGLERGDTRLVELGQSVEMAVRVDRAGRRFTDYQTVMGEPLMTADGKKREEAIISPRQYLEDASFLVVLAGDSELLDEAARALESPRWPLYLGRRCCVPTRPILMALTDEYNSVEEALDKAPYAERCDAPDAIVREFEGTGSGPAMLRSDVLIDAKRRIYRTRRVTRSGRHRS